MGVLLLLATVPVYLLLSGKSGSIIVLAVLLLGSFALIGDLAPGYYLIAVCLFSLWALTTIRRQGGRPLFLTSNKDTWPPKVTFYSGPDCACIRGRSSRWGEN